MLNIQRALNETALLPLATLKLSNRVALSCMRHPGNVPVQTSLASITSQCLSLPLQVRTECRRFAHVTAMSGIEDMHGVNRQGRTSAFLGLGSNVGDRFANIEEACRALEKQDNIKLLRTSGLWETEPMYVIDQNRFLNGACEIETSCSPLELLDKLQAIETSLGRVKTVDKGPRNIDLDVLLYDNKVVEEKRLQVPHKLMLEREFVLRPLCELIPNQALPPPYESVPLIKHLQNLPTSSSPISTLTPLTPTVRPLTPLLPTRRTQVMSILNLTPDSFSDGGLYVPTSKLQTDATYICKIQSTIAEQIALGATIIDIGGQSSRPNAASITAAEETSRVIPVIELIRSLPGAETTTISIDTYRASVAEAAVNAGAHIINDISAGMLDPDMLATMAKLGCTAVLMHMRGNPESMTRMTDYSAYPGGVVEGVATELLARVKAAEDAGIRRWRIILDPGIGFAKDQAQNLELLRRFAELRNWEGLRGLPWVVGSSRKGFVGKVTGVKEPRERAWGTAATVTCAVMGGADVVRVHDVAEMVQVVKMSDAIFRA